MRLPLAGDGQSVVGVAITVPEPFCGELHDARLRLGDPEAHNVVPHVTLVGPTPVDDDRIDELDAHLACTVAAHRPFHVRLHGTRTFRPVSPVVFVALVEGGEQCAALESSVRSGPLQVPAQFPYHPHVTIAHDVDDVSLDLAEKEMAHYEAGFDVTHVHRFVHDGTAWRPARSFVLGAVGALADAGSQEQP